MQKYFNTAGPIIPEDHYHIDLLWRLDWDEIRHLIASKKYFVLHAPRQTGKTSTLLAMMQALNAAGQYQALYVNIEAAQAARQDAEAGLAIICETIASTAVIYGIQPELEALTTQLLAEKQARSVLTILLSRWAQRSDKPIVLMLDEVDALVGDTLISLLRQIRAGYAQRPRAFPQSIILCGVRDVRDYRIHTSDREIITGGSAFNIKATSLVMGNFNPDEVQALYQQHTEETGQTFADRIFPLLWEDTRGQPWLVNALGYEMTWEDRQARDRSMPITLEHYRAARERLIRSRQTHLDQLADKLREPRVQRVIGAILAGNNTLEGVVREDDLQYIEDLGLIIRKPQVRIANAIYREIIPREITAPVQDGITNQETVWYVLPDGRLDISALLRAFQQFFREHSDIWLQGLPFREAGPQLILQAFLQRLVNGGGRINREYALGRKYTDLLLEWPLDPQQGFYGAVQRVVLELKILHGSLDKTIADGVRQVADYARRCGSEEACLLIFNRAPDVGWDAKIWHKTGFQDGNVPVSVWGC
ncbi:MAG: AAA-like domain-containing protein [Thiothrix sp.]|nr:AAA-like domain-containing protein [Thiothrix sp.]